ncbi:MAG TPA: SDR family NAD(P)-dependent oxidoreductase [Steroidobacteraceae bacterium]|jgi:NAD(P)-dependent dehydrogenase (short-subunit alcohol dehydrogenase family)
MNGRVCVVTGATHGIGLATARALAARGARVLVHGRDLARAEAVVVRLRRETGNTELTAVQADFARLADVRRLGAELAALPRLDVLINNAATMAARGALSAEHYDLTFAVNHLAPFLLTQLLLAKLTACAPARVIIVASEAHRRARLDFDDLMNDRVTGHWSAYNRSKLANLLFARALARRLSGSGVTVNALHPGVVSTQLFRDLPLPVRVALGTIGRLVLLSPRQGADTSVYLASAPELAGASGGYYRRRRPLSPSAAAQSDADAERLWQESLQLTGLAA